MYIIYNVSTKACCDSSKTWATLQEIPPSLATRFIIFFPLLFVFVLFYNNMMWYGGVAWCFFYIMWFVEHWHMWCGHLLTLLWWVGVVLQGTVLAACVCWLWQSTYSERANDIQTFYIASRIINHLTIILFCLGNDTKWAIVRVEWCYFQLERYSPGGSVHMACQHVDPI